MSPHKEVFDEPVVRVQFDKVRFPQVCPVCGAKATESTRITLDTRKRYLSRSWDPMGSPTWRARFGHGSYPTYDVVSLRIPVCEDHVVSDESDCRSRILCVVYDGLLLGALLVTVMAIGSDLWTGRGVAPWTLVVLSLVLVAGIISIVVFRPRPLEKAVRIVGFDHGVHFIWLAFSDPAYRDLFLKENEMHAQLVGWVLRA